MRRIALLLGAAALVGYGVTAALGGCGGDEATVTPEPDGAASSSGSTSGDQTSGGTSGATSGGTSGGTSGSSGDPDGGGTSSSGNLGATNPGRVTCGATECDAGGFNNNVVCCYRDAGAACGRQQGPGNPPDECTDNTFQTECDEPADCPGIGGGGNRACCLRLRAQGTIAAAQTCGQFGQGCGNDNGPRVCKTTADCGDAGACAVKNCGGRQVGVCGSPTGCM
jgi:hypothetical protein